ncbi:Crp/Fnr family transcriptional regulator [candidate division KSB1 bacterium]
MKDRLRPYSSRQFAKGETVFNEGDSNTEMFIIISGEAEVVKKVNEHEIILTKLGIGDFFGEMAMFGDETRSATVRVAEDLETIVITKEEFISQFDDLPGWFTNMFEELINRIRAIDEKIIAQFRSGVEFSVLQLIQLLAHHYGIHSHKQVTVNKDFIKEKIEYILGISDSLIEQCINDLIETQIIDLEKKTGKILIKDTMLFDQFIDFYQGMVKHEDIKIVMEHLKNIDESHLNEFNRQYSAISKSYRGQISILNT